MRKGLVQRFDRWRGRQSSANAYFIQLVLDEVVPLFEAAGYQRYEDYAGNNPQSVGASTIALQRRSGQLWPTVEIQFRADAPHFLGLYFSLLPELCYRHGTTPIPRLDANVVEGPYTFMLCKGGNKNYDCNFGYPWFSFMPRRRLQKEAGELARRIPWLLQTLDAGIPNDWLSQRRAAQVGKYARILFNWADGKNAEWVAVYVALDGGEYGSQAERDAIHRFTDELSRAIAASGTGVFDGDEFGKAECGLFMYGLNADRLFAVVEPLLRNWPPMQGGFAFKRYGASTGEVRIDF